MSATTEENRNRLVRLAAIIGRKELKNKDNKVIKEEIKPLIPVCKATWYAGMKSGKYPAGIRISPRVVMWRLSDVMAIVNRAPNE